MASLATMVDYEAALFKLEMINKTLKEDQDPQAVKRVTRDLACIHSLSLPTSWSGTLGPKQCGKGLKEICSVTHKVIRLLTRTHHEGTALNLVMCLELVLKLVKNSDMLRGFSRITQMTRQAVKALLELARAPHVGGSALCVAMRALMSVACYQVDLRPRITELVEDLISSPPPNLFDHNNRSLHKIFQRGLSQLLECVEDDGDKEKLVNLTARVKESYESLVSATEAKKQTSPLPVAELGSRSCLSPPSNERTKLPEKNAVKEKLNSCIRLTKAEIRLFGPESLPEKVLRSRRVQKILQDAKNEKRLKNRPSPWASITSIPEKSLTKEILSSPAPSSTAPVEPCKKRFPSDRSSNSPPMSGKKPANDDDNISKNVASEESHNPIPDNTFNKTVSETGIKQSEQSDLERVIQNHLDLNFETEVNSSDGYSEQFLARCSNVESKIFQKLDRKRVVDFFLTNSTFSQGQIPNSPEWAYVDKLKTKKEKLLRSLSAYFPGSNFWPETSGSASGNLPCINPPSFYINRTEPPSQPCRDGGGPETSNSVGHSPVQACSSANDLLFPNKDIDLRPKLMSPPESGTQSHPADDGSSLLKLTSVGVPNSSALLESPEAAFSRDQSLPLRAQDDQLNVHPVLEKNSSTSTISPYLAASEETPCRAGPSSQEVDNTTVFTEPSTTSGSALWMPSTLLPFSTQSNVPTASTRNSVPVNSVRECAIPLMEISNVSRDSHHNWGNVHNGLQNEINRHDRTKWVNSRSRDTREKENFDPQVIPRRDFTHGNYAGSRQTTSVNPYQMPEIAYRRRSELDNPYKIDHSQFYNAKPRPAFNGHQGPMLDARSRRHPQHDWRSPYNTGPRQSPNVNPYFTRNARPNPDPVHYPCRPPSEAELEVNVHLLGDREATTPLYRTAEGAPRALRPVRAYGPGAGRGPAFGSPYTRDRYRGGEMRRSF